jgi:hypothetical protein
MKLIWVSIFMVSALFAQSLESEPVEKREGREVCAGYWRFVKEDFRKRHPFLPGFLVKRALNTRLYIGKNFIQYESPDVMIGKARLIEKVEELKADHFSFSRKEGDKKVDFEFYKKDEKWFYREGDLFYQLIKDNEEDQRVWREKR